MARIAAGAIVAVVVGVAGYFGARAGVHGPHGRSISHPLGIVTGSSATGTGTGTFVLCSPRQIPAAKRAHLFTQSQVVRAFAGHRLHLHSVPGAKRYYAKIPITAALQLNRSGFEQANIEGPPLVAFVWATVGLAGCAQRGPSPWVGLRAGNVEVTVFTPAPKGLIRRAKAALADLRSAARSLNR